MKLKLLDIFADSYMCFLCQYSL